VKLRERIEGRRRVRVGDDVAADDLGLDHVETNGVPHDEAEDVEGLGAGRGARTADRRLPRPGAPPS
jgi:hypothetical protein